MSPSIEFVQAVVRRRGMFNIIHVASGSKADFIVLKDDDFARSESARRTWIPFTASRDACAATPEDVIVAKLRYFDQGYSAKHPRDIAGMLRVSGERLDRDDIDLEALVRKHAQAAGLRDRVPAGVTLTWQRWRSLRIL